MRKQTNKFGDKGSTVIYIANLFQTDNSLSEPEQAEEIAIEGAYV